jgi:hypothetical protein
MVVKNVASSSQGMALSRVSSVEACFRMAERKVERIVK